mmetsp:Transcript_38113/g.91527  ORF Transcript_38113/g.91527 Transcript_38113/m.91527 type:complete len:104 (+) Transcript_38113:1198-1509(+)
MKLPMVCKQQGRSLRQRGEAQLAALVEQHVAEQAGAGTAHQSLRVLLQAQPAGCREFWCDIARGIAWCILGPGDSDDNKLPIVLQALLRGGRGLHEFRDSRER